MPKSGDTNCSEERHAADPAAAYVAAAAAVVSAAAAVLAVSDHAVISDDNAFVIICLVSLFMLSFPLSFQILVWL